MSKVGRKPVESRSRQPGEFGQWAGAKGAWLLLILMSAAACARPGVSPKGAAVSPSLESKVPQPSSRQLPVGGNDIRWGDANAPVTIVAFLDFECPFCAQVHTTLTELLEEYGPQKLRLVVKHAPLPFHPRGVPAARATQAVYQLGGSEVFLAYVGRVFEHPDALGDQALLSWAGELGVASESYTREVASQAVQSKVRDDLALAEAVGVSGVPAFYINGASIVGARPKADFVAAIEHELRAAQELTRRGVDSGSVFAERVAVNFSSQPAEPPPFEAVAYQVPLGTSPTRGPATAPVTIVEFADFECPFCEQAHHTVEALMAKYPNQLRWVMKHNPLPFHPLAEPAAVLALEVRRHKGDAAYWQALNQLYAAPNLSTDLLSSVANQFGVPEAALVEVLDSSSLPAQVIADQDLAMDLNAMGTPHFFVNGRRMVGAQPLSVFEQLVQEELQKGVALGSVAEPYALLQRNALPPQALTKHNVPPPPPTSPVLGSTDAAVVIQMFADFECAYCIRVLPTLATLRAKYPGQIKLVWRHLPLPFHKNAKRAAAAALEAQAQLGPRGFWQMAEKLMGLPNAFAEPQPVAKLQPVTAALSPEALEKAARELGLDDAKFSAALSRGSHDAAIAQDEALARSLEVHGTPAFFVGPYALDGAQPLSRFERLVRKVIDEMQQN